jgi:hypothetical protein
MGRQAEGVRRTEMTVGVVRQHEPLPLVSAEERAFWRRAVEIERARQRCASPTPFQREGTLPDFARDL